MIRLQLVLFVLSIMFAFYGVQEIREALQDGRTLRHGTEALIMSGGFAAFAFWLDRFRAKGPADPPDDL